MDYMIALLLMQDIGGSTVVVCLGLGGFLGHRAFSAETEKSWVNWGG